MTSVAKLAITALGVVIAMIVAVVALDAGSPTDSDLGPPAEVTPSNAATSTATGPDPSEPPTPVASDNDHDSDDDDDEDEKDDD